MVDAKSISFIARSKRRKEVLEILARVKKMSQPEIMKVCEQYKSHNSRTLKELKEKVFISCINPEDRAYKFYKITKKGKDALKEVKKVSRKN
jgi:DNA-binding MarR family transcriptional regulator